MGMPTAVAELEAAVLDACAGEGEWPAQIAAGIYAAVDFAIARPQVVEAVSLGSDPIRDYESLIGRFTGFIQVRAPIEQRLPGTPDEALVAGIVGMVGDHVRLGRTDRLSELRADLVLLALLPYLGFAEARVWANRLEEDPPGT
jgi:hypothetical protein